MELKKGFYWVKFQPTGEWEVVEMRIDELDGTKYFDVIGEGNSYEEFDLFSFNENRILSPDETREINVIEEDCMREMGDDR